MTSTSTPLVNSPTTRAIPSSPSSRLPGTVRLAAIGLGERAAWMLQAMVETAESMEGVSVRLDALVDPNPTQADEQIEKYKLPCATAMARYDDVEAFLDAGVDVDGLVLGTRCHLHTPIAVKLVGLGLPLFLEKPVAISWAQLVELRDAYRDAKSSQVVVSFPLRRTPIFEAVCEVVASGRLGTINQIQAVNNVNYGNVYVDNWYREYDLAGGLWLQKATHDFDYMHHLARLSGPTQSPANMLQKNQGDHAKNTENTGEKRGNAGENVGGVPVFVTAMHSRQHWQEPVLNQDSGSALIQYHNGVHACYTQNFLTRKTAGLRGATITGDAGTVRFDWVAATIRVIDHDQDRVDDIRIDDGVGHGGGDHRLARNFLDVILGRDESITPLRHGLLSAATCLAARDAANRRTVERIDGQWTGGDVTIDDRPIEPMTD